MTKSSITLAGVIRPDVCSNGKLNTRNNEEIAGAQAEAVRIPLADGTLFFAGGKR
jgi:hypothetical protein